LLGIGIGYVPFHNTEIYANISQNYRGITFNDMKVSNPNAQVDSNLKDESGFNADVGVRGNWREILDFDVSLFYLFYKNRIGSLQKVDNNINIYSYTTNISDSRNVGLEFFGEINLNNLFKRSKYYGTFSIYQSLALIDARYIDTPDLSIKDKKVEFAPSLTNRMGLTYKIGKFSSTLQFAFTGYQYADATNAYRSGNAVIGLIPPYWVMDWSANYTLKNFSFSFNINNLSNQIYFTRRASSYPGPGIIPAEPRMIYFGLGYKI
jgi:Fe(3+) dicitrate transport protein